MINPGNYPSRDLAELASDIIRGARTLEEAAKLVSMHFDPGSLIDIWIKDEKFVVGVREDIDGYDYIFHCNFGPKATSLLQTT